MSDVQASAEEYKLLQIVIEVSDTYGNGQWLSRIGYSYDIARKLDRRGWIERIPPRAIIGAAPFYKPTAAGRKALKEREADHE